MNCAWYTITLYFTSTFCTLAMQQNVFDGARTTKLSVYESFSIFSSKELFLYLTDGQSNIILGRVPLTTDPGVVVLMVNL